MKLYQISQTKQMSYISPMPKAGTVPEPLSSQSHILTLYQTSLFFAWPIESICWLQNIKFVFHRVQNIVEKGKNPGYQHFLLFPQFFQKACFSGVFNPLPNKPWFLRVWRASLLKTLREKEKLLVTSNFSFSHSVFYPFWELSVTFMKFEIVVCKLFQFGRI